MMINFLAYGNQATIKPSLDTTASRLKKVVFLYYGLCLVSQKHKSISLLHFKVDLLICQLTDLKVITWQHNAKL